MMSQLPRPAISKVVVGSRLPKPPPSGVRKRHHSASPERVSPKKRSTQDLNRTCVGSSMLHTRGAASLRTANTAAPKSNLKRAASTQALSSQPCPVPSNITTRRPLANSSASNKQPSVGTNAAAAKKKRPAWDVKGRLLDMEDAMGEKLKERDTLVKEMENYNVRIHQLESVNDQMHETVKVTNEENTENNEKIETLQADIRKYNADVEETRRRHKQECDDFKFQVSGLQRQKETLEGELEAARQECTGLRGSVAQLSAAQAGVSAELDSTKLLVAQANRVITERDEEIERLKTRVSQHETELDARHNKIVMFESERRKLHNTIQELKGNIRVFCRVRPLLKCEGGSDNDAVVPHMNFPDPDHKVLELEKNSECGSNEIPGGAKRGGNYDFSFDRVFTPESTQEDVFNEISQLVQSALDGYNVCIFAYGQTGSGKTYTMEGAGRERNKGMIPRAVTQVFENARELADKAWTYTFEASFLEIYNETLRDLLGDGKVGGKIEVKQAGHDVMVTNINTVQVYNEREINRLLELASENRAVAETKCNERSSRSHSIFRLKIYSTNGMTGEKAEGYLNLVDLAGSERLKESGSEGQRLKETQAINKSLSTLGQVITALANKDSHIPYRNSKLTYLLQNSLGGNSKTLMFVNVSPREDSFSETLCSLRFATKVNQCHIGTAQKKVK